MNGSFWDCQSVPTGSAFEFGPNWNPARGNGKTAPNGTGIGMSNKDRLFDIRFSVLVFG